MKKFFKNDFRNVKDALESLVDKHIPIGIFTIYYVIVGLICLVPGLLFILGLNIYKRKHK